MNLSATSWSWEIEVLKTNLSLVGSARYYWRTKNWVRTYSEVGIGPSLCWEKSFYDESYKKKFLPTVHLAILGIEVENGHVIGIGEFGLGAFGVFRGGIGYRFRGQKKLVRPTA